MVKVRLFYRPPARIAKTVYNNAVLDDQRLDPGAAGLLMCLIVDSRRGWFAFNDLVRRNPLDGRHKIRRYLNMLFDAGYIRLMPANAQSNPVFGARYAVNRYVEIPTPVEQPDEADDQDNVACSPRSFTGSEVIDLPPVEQNLAWIYVATAGPVAKVGTSIQVAVRLRKLKEERPLGVGFSFAYAIPCEFAATIERRIHRRLRNHLVSGEWFLASAEMIQESIVETISREFHLPLRRHPKRAA